MQRRCGGQNDEEHSQIGEEGTDPYIDAPIGQFQPGRAVAARDHGLSARFLLLDLLPCLPEEKVRTDGGAEYGHQRAPALATVWKTGYQRRVQHGRPVRMYQEGR